ncbi:MAG: IS21 family transposase [Deltaproteobacteria bacterium]
MRKTRELLRLKHLGRSQRQIASSLCVAVGTVCGQLRRARDAGMTWERAQGMTDTELESTLFRDCGRNVAATRVAIDYSHVHGELHRDGVTLQLLWSEYLDGVAARGDGTKPYQYSQFCELYGAWRSRLQPSMRIVHRAGEKAFVDYSGKKPKLWDRVTGEAREVELFVMVLGASSYTYAEATLTQRLPDFVSSTIRGFEYFDGVPEMLVPDQLRSAVKGPDRYEPDINATYLEMAQHYGVVVLPARPRRPKDKAKVEVGVQVVQRWILARLRNRKFFELGELNQAIWELLDELNARPFQKLEGSRESAFAALDKPALRPLPAVRYELAERKTRRVNIDYHIEYDGRYYSVPYERVHAEVEVRATATLVEIFQAGERVASHRRSLERRGSMVTEPCHRPVHHRHQVWPPERLIAWGASFGPSVARVVELTLGRYVNPEQGYRACLGLMRTAQRHGATRMNAACERALSVSIVGGPRRKYIEAILKRGLEREGVPATPTPRTSPLTHENVRGGDYYDKETVH